MRQEEFGSTHLTIFCPLDNIGSSKLKNTIRVEISRTDDKIGNRMESSRKNWGPIKKPSGARLRSSKWLYFA